MVLGGSPHSFGSRPLSQGPSGVKIALKEDGFTIHLRKLSLFITASHVKVTKIIEKAKN
jgi:hypothetical protein